jgi:hypothetical protein
MICLNPQCVKPFCPGCLDGVRRVDLAAFSTSVTVTCGRDGRPRQHLRVERVDGKDGIGWDELQEIKDAYMGRDVWCVEVYPAAHAVVNEQNMRHLWEVFDDEMPFGWGRR